MLIFYLLIGFIYVVILNIIVWMMYIFDVYDIKEVIPTNKKGWIRMILCFIISILLWPFVMLFVHILGLADLYELN